MACNIVIQCFQMSHVLLQQARGVSHNVLATSVEIEELGTILEPGLGREQLGLSQEPQP